MKWQIAISQLLLISSLVLAKDNVGSSTEGDETQAFERKNDRQGKTLRNSFPFNAVNEGHHHHQDNDNRLARQGAVGDATVLDIDTIAKAGERCINKVITVEETEYDDTINCKHSYTERCYTSYKTDYSPQQEEECDENYKKSCFIEYKKEAFQEKVKYCFQPLVRDCNQPGPTECTTEYTTQCITRYHEHDVEDDVPNCVETKELKCQTLTQGYTTEEKCTEWPVQKCDLQTQRTKKFTPETHCKKVPFEICGPAACPIVPGPEQCQDKEETIVQDVPEEICNLEPRTECKHVTKLVPLLKPAEECVDIPKEICVRSKGNPRRVKRPIVKKWCYTPSDKTGFNNNDNGDSNVRIVTEIPIIDPPTETGCLAGYPANHCSSRSRNGNCDRECNTPACGYDGGDCRTTPTPRTTTRRPEGCAPGYSISHCKRRAKNGRCDPECNTQACFFDGGDCTIVTPPPPPTPTKPIQGCARGYPSGYCESRYKNGKCDQECNINECRYDGGDCTIITPPPPGCARGKPAGYCESRYNNGRCDVECNTQECGFDGSDCTIITPPPPGCGRGKPAGYCESRYNNGQCDVECNTQECGFDGGDCTIITPPPAGCARGYPSGYCESRSNNGQCDRECNTNECGFDGGDCTIISTPPTRTKGCAQGYPVGYCESRYKNKQCDEECNTVECGYDGGDCTVIDRGYLPPSY